MFKLLREINVDVNTLTEEGNLRGFIVSNGTQGH